MAGLSPRLPLNVDEDDGAYGLNKTMKDVVKQNFKMLLLTIPGERIMDPLFGVGIKKFLFEQNVEETYDIIASEIRAQTAKYLSYINIDDIQITGQIDDTLDNNFINIKVAYKILPLDIDDILSVTETRTE